MSIFNNFPVIDLGDIVLRELSEDDISDFLHYLNDPQVSKYMAEEDVPKNNESALRELSYWKDLYKYRRSVYWGIAKSKTNKLIGTCGFNSWNSTNRRCEISYDLSRKEWGQGIMNRSIKALAEFAFIRMKVNRIQATVAHHNERSIKLLERLNFQQEGVLRDYNILAKEKTNFYMYSLLSDELEF